MHEVTIRQIAPIHVLNVPSLELVAFVTKKATQQLYAQTNLRTSVRTVRKKVRHSHESVPCDMITKSFHQAIRH